jgi:hypothetical protein
MTATRSVSPLNKVAWVYPTPDPTAAQYSGGSGNLDLATLEIREIPTSGGGLPAAAGAGAVPVSSGAGYVYVPLERGGAGLALGVNDAGSALQYRRYIHGVDSYGTIRQGDVGWQWNNSGDVNRLRVYFQGYTDHSDLLRFDGSTLTVGETGGDFTFNTVMLGTRVTLGPNWFEGRQTVTAAMELAFAIPETDVALRVFARLALDDASKVWCGHIDLHFTQGGPEVAMSVDTIDGDHTLFDAAAPSVTGSGGSKVLHVAFTGAASGTYQTARV